jgi:tetratricopeptide (TPR) repeat protein
VHDKKAIAINPGNAIATYNLARAYYFKKDYPKTIELFKKTLALQPSFALGFLNLARCYADNKQYDSAIVYYNKTLSLDPDQQLAKQGLLKANALRNTADTTNKSNEIK